MEKKKCHCCEGTGQETDNVKLGRSFSGYRLRAKIPLREMARRLAVSHTYLWQMEHGARPFPVGVKNNYIIQLFGVKPTPKDLL